MPWQRYASNRGKDMVKVTFAYHLKAKACHFGRLLLLSESGKRMLSKIKHLID